MPTQERNSYLVIGLGRFGRNVARTLFENGHDVLGMDSEMSEVQAAIDEKILSDAIQINGTDTVALQKLELGKFAAIVICIGTDIENSVLIAATLKDLNVQKVIAKASNPIHGMILEKLGVDQIVYPEAEMGRRVARELIGLNFLEQFTLSETFSIAELPLPDEYANSQLAETDIRSKHHLNILAIRRAGGQFNVSPTPKTQLQKDDYILVLGTHDDIENFRDLQETEVLA